jgi:copper(I)-binding protein
VTGARADAYGKVMLHRHETAGGMSAMTHVEKVVVPAGGKFAFAPGEHHIMLERPATDISIGSHQRVTLLFDGGRALATECEVRPPATLK